MIKHHHKCDHCGKGMSEGFYDDGTYYCSVECLLAGNIKRLKGKPYTLKDWKKDCENNPDDCYWTAWEERLRELLLNGYRKNRGQV